LRTRIAAGVPFVGECQGLLTPFETLRKYWRGGCVFVGHVTKLVTVLDFFGRKANKEGRRIKRGHLRGGTPSTDHRAT